MLRWLLLALLLTGCVSYNPIQVERLSHKNQYTDVTEELCEDFYKGAVALGEGPERAYPWLGRARELEAMQVIMLKQGAACYSLLSREDLFVVSDDEWLNGADTNSYIIRALSAFRRTWKAAAEATN